MRMAISRCAQAPASSACRRAPGRRNPFQPPRRSPPPSREWRSCVQTLRPALGKKRRHVLHDEDGRADDSQARPAAPRASALGPPVETPISTMGAAVFSLDSRVPAGTGGARLARLPGLAGFASWRSQDGMDLALPRQRLNHGPQSVAQLGAGCLCRRPCPRAW